ncbi:MAG: hypothetical protein K0R63_539 [Rickettsiales bacterium]|jgi:hypothetical protein|nr:hypothetical protein [Rickettsiales bacterium]
MRKVLLLLLFTSTITACYGGKPAMFPQWRQDSLVQGIPGASRTFNMGWRDGCESGGATAATQLQRLYHGFKMNEQMIENDEYYNGWNKGFRHCHRYLYQYHKKMFSD